MERRSPGSTADVRVLRAIPDLHKAEKNRPRPRAGSRKGSLIILLNPMWE